jgi:DNA polymerase II large subunit
MNQTEVEARHDPLVKCNSCEQTYRPYPDTFAPIIDEVKCPKCGTTRVLYYGEDSTVIKMILNTYGLNKELNERLDKLDTELCSLKDMVKTSLDDARNIMTRALVGSLKEQLLEHEKNYHNYGGSVGKSKP